MVLAVVVAEAAVVVLAIDAVLGPSEKPVTVPVVEAAAVAVEAGADVVVAGTRGLIIKVKLPPVAVVVAVDVLAAEAETALKAKPGPAAVAAAVVIG